MQLVGWEKGIQIDQFTAEESPPERQALLANFASGNLQALAAMKCLDEGVDVPSTRTAYFLASSSNPREFIQTPRTHFKESAQVKNFQSFMI
ncbi:MAG: hypothetical protein IPM76_10940 [Chloroflexi bacterium]|nr:hypothetical protein [Chloroflexota bacterium]